jgi:hypothetical protein
MVFLDMGGDFGLDSAILARTEVTSFRCDLAIISTHSLLT